jgi:S-adenosylmethionine:tRNA ribosyltransferase-isomerase
VDPLAPYRYELPEERIARHPPERRDGGRLMSLGPQGLAHRRVVELPGLLRAGDLLVVNETRVLPARLHGRRSTGGRVEVFLLGAGPGPVRALLRPGKKLRPGERLELDSGAVLLLERFEDGSWLVEASPSPGALMAAEGAMPLPPYLRREALDADRERYQTVFARVDGAVAAPTAGLHLSEEVLAELRARGVGLARITLHVGAGTFRNLRPEELQRGELHPERYEVPEETARGGSSRWGPPSPGPWSPPAGPTGCPAQALALPGSSSGRATPSGASTGCSPTSTCPPPAC